MTARARTAVDPNLPLRRFPTSVRWIPEPILSFAGGATAIDPRVGIALAGPRSYGTGRHPNPVNVGFIGTGPDVDMARRYLEDVADGVDGTDDHHPFPGFRSDRGFRTELRTSSDLEARVTANEVRSVMEKGKRQKDRFDELLGILVDRLALLCDRDHPLDCVYVVIPGDVYARCRVADYTKDRREVHRDLRAAVQGRGHALPHADADPPPTAARPATSSSTSAPGSTAKRSRDSRTPSPTSTTTSSRCAGRATSGCSATASTRHRAGPCSTSATATTCTRPGRSPSSATTRTPTSPPRSGSSATPATRRLTGSCPTCCCSPR